MPARSQKPPEARPQVQSKNGKSPSKLTPATAARIRAQVDRMMAKE